MKMAAWLRSANCTEVGRSCECHRTVQLRFTVRAGKRLRRNFLLKVRHNIIVLHQREQDINKKREQNEEPTLAARTTLAQGRSRAQSSEATVIPRLRRDTVGNQASPQPHLSGGIFRRASLGRKIKATLYQKKCCLTVVLQQLSYATVLMSDTRTVNRLHTTKRIFCTRFGSFEQLSNTSIDTHKTHDAMRCDVMRCDVMRCDESKKTHLEHKTSESAEATELLQCLNQIALGQ